MKFNVQLIGLGAMVGVVMVDVSNLKAQAAHVVAQELKKGNAEPEYFEVPKGHHAACTWLSRRREKRWEPSTESPGPMAITNLGEFKFSAIERFRGILHRTVKASFGNNSPSPPWATGKVIEAWNVPGF